MGALIDYEHRFEPAHADSTRLVWTVRCRGRAGVRAHLFSAVYARLIDRLATIQGLSPAIPERELNTPAGPAGVVSAARSFPLPAFDDVAPAIVLA